VSRAAGISRALILPAPSNTYDATNERETRRLIEQFARQQTDWSAITSTPPTATALGSLTGAPDMLPYFSGISTMALAALTPYARTIIACASAAAMRTALGLGPLATLTTPSDATKFLNGAASPAFAQVKDSDLSLSNVTSNDVTSAAHGFAPKSPADATKFLNGAAAPVYVQVKDSDLSLSNITTNDVSTTKHGFAPILPNDATKFLNGVGAWTAPAGGSGGAVVLPTLTTGGASYQGRFSAEPTVSTITMDVDGRVSAITDALGLWGSSLGVGAFNKPRWLARAMNGRPGIVFNGSTGKLLAGATRSLPQPFTAVMVFQNWKGGAGNNNMFTDAGSGLSVFINGGTAWAMFAGTSLTSTALMTANTEEVPDGTIAAPAVAISVFNGASSVLRNNNNTEVTGNAGTSGFTGVLYVGGDSTVSFAHTVFYEIVFIAGAINATDRAAIVTAYASALRMGQ
jgi:hypothetical protein